MPAALEGIAPFKERRSALLDLYQQRQATDFRDADLAASVEDLESTWAVACLGGWPAWPSWLGVGRVARAAASRLGLHLAYGVTARVRAILAATPRGEHFGNARYARNLLEQAIATQALRITRPAPSQQRYARYA